MAPRPAGGLEAPAEARPLASAYGVPADPAPERAFFHVGAPATAEPTKDAASTWCGRGSAWNQVRM